MFKLLRKLIFYFNENQNIEYNKYNFFLFNNILKILIFYGLFSFKNINYLNKREIIDIDNKINETLYEDDIDFSQFSTKIKAIAIFFPQFIYIKNNYTFSDKSLNEWKNIENVKPIFNFHKQPRNLNRKYKNNIINNFSKIEYIKMSVKLAKNHGIYGFAIIYYWFSGKILYDEPINIFLKNKDINFPFFLIWKNDKYEFNSNNKNNSIIINQNYTAFEAYNFFNDIKKYLISKYYIKLNGKPILGIYEPLIIIKFKNFISNLRKYAKKFGIGKIYILGAMNENQNSNYTKLIDAYFEFPPKNINLNELLKNEYYYYYEGLIYRDNYKNIYNKTYRGIMLEYDNTPETLKDPIVFSNYSPEKFYLSIRKIIISKKIKKKILFINGWNNWKEGIYLEPDDIYGFASINALSKALFNLTFEKDIHNLENLKINCKVVIQAHIFYKDLIEDIINKINNIPIKFDLFISTNSIEIKNIIKEYVIKNSRANYFEIIIVKNKGRDVLPFLIQLRNNIKKYKYICHIHSKKSKTSPEIGFAWRNYLYENLLGNEKIVSGILSDFENNYKLGFIFPDTFYDIIIHKQILTKKTLKYMKFLLKRIFPKYKLGTKLDFPAGNMFWAKTNSIYQIFEIDLDKMFDKEKDQTNDTIMHGIERIWLYLVKLNGYYYKTIFKSY